MRIPPWSKMKTKVHLVSFYTEGYPYDNGDDLRVAARMFKEISNGYFDSVTLFCPRELVVKDYTWNETLRDQRDWVTSQIIEKKLSIKWNEKWAALNFLIWKPRLMLDIVQNSDLVNDGDIVLYHDVDLIKYTDYFYGIRKWKKYITKKINKKSVMLFDDNGFAIYKDTKHELIKKYLGEDFDTNSETHVWAGALAIKKTNYGLQFLGKWLEMCNEIQNVSPITEFSNKPGYIWHSQEQACLSVLYCLEKNEINKQFLWGKRKIPPRSMDILKCILKYFCAF